MSSPVQKAGAPSWNLGGPPKQKIPEIAETVASVAELRSAADERKESTPLRGATQDPPPVAKKVAKLAPSEIQKKLAANGTPTREMPPNVMPQSPKIMGSPGPGAANVEVESSRINIPGNPYYDFQDPVYLFLKNLSEHWSPIVMQDERRDCYEYKKSVTGKINEKMFIQHYLDARNAALRDVENFMGLVKGEKGAEAKEAEWKKYLSLLQRSDFQQSSRNRKDSVVKLYIKERMKALRLS
ncbi:MAG: hypothetical protein JSS32_10565 [Verrucomicrobia bacterium]|nr:hypothetical protein [Verrucomicrobiota bacterium]